VWRIRDVYPGSRILIFTQPGSRISDTGSKNSNKRERWKKICCHNFLYSHKFHKIVNYFSFEVLKKKIWANFQRIKELFTKKLSKSSQKYGLGIRDPRTGIRKKPIPDPGSRGQKGTGSQIRIRNTVIFPQFVGSFHSYFLSYIYLIISHYNARIYRPSFRENKHKTLVFNHWKRAFWACFRENGVYKFGHRYVNAHRTGAFLNSGVVAYVASLSLR
jgi:hypothetical protein